MPRLLVIDDEPGLRTLYQRALSADGYEVETAANCDQALAILGSHPIDLVVLDIQIDGQNGLELLNRITRDFRNLPVILCTAYSCYQEDLASWQAHAYLVKSSNLEPLKQEIRRLVGK